MGQIGEWFWRFLAAVMVFAVGWMLWIFHQINPTPLVTSAAFEAAAKASARQNSGGVIQPAKPAEPPPSPLAAGPAIGLKYAESLALPEADAKQ